MCKFNKQSWLKNNYHFLFGLIITIVICYFPVFHHLGVKCIRIWDEGENAVNAFEMLQNSNYIVKYYEGEPDMWSLKPPFLIWNQVFCMKVLGLNELAIRLPSAIFALFTILIIIRFFIKEFDKPEMGFFTAMILVTSQGYIDRHIVRTGDHDATLTFFLISSFIYFYKYLKYQQIKTFYLIVVTLSILLAVYTKGIVGILFVPALIIWAAIQGKLKYIFFARSTYVAIFGFLFVTIGYYLLREYFNPGYLKAVWNDELFPRYLNKSENYLYQHNDDFWYYFRNLWQSRFVPWIYFLPPVCS